MNRACSFLDIFHFVIVSDDMIKALWLNLESRGEENIDIDLKVHCIKAQLIKEQNKWKNEKPDNNNKNKDSSKTTMRKVYALSICLARKCKKKKEEEKKRKKKKKKREQWLDWRDGRPIVENAILLRWDWEREKKDRKREKESGRKCEKKEG